MKPTYEECVKALEYINDKYLDMEDGDAYMLLQDAIETLKPTPNNELQYVLQNIYADLNTLAEIKHTHTSGKDMDIIN